MRHLLPLLLTTTIFAADAQLDEAFAPAAAAPAVPEGTPQWCKLREAWMDALRKECFGGWPAKDGELQLREVGTEEHEGVVMRAWDFTPQEPWALRLYVAHRAGLKPEELELVVLNALDESAWQDFRKMMAFPFASLFAETERSGATGDGFADEQKMFASQKWAMAYVAPRGIGPTAWTGTEKEMTQHLRRFYLLGQTLDGMQTWDIRRAIGALRKAGFAKPALWLQAQNTMAGNALYASLFEHDVARLDLHGLPTSHATGPVYLNVLRHLDIPQAVAMATGRSKVRIYTAEKSAWDWPVKNAELREWKKSLELRDTIER